MICTHRHTDTHPHTQTNVTYGCSMIVNTSMKQESLPRASLQGAWFQDRFNNFAKCLKTYVPNRC